MANAAPPPVSPEETPGPVLMDSPVTPSSPQTWARFEFETGKANEGTKILMVEWDPAAEDYTAEAEAVSPTQGQDDDGWEVSWEGKATTFSVRGNSGDTTQRIYFLIPSGLSIPPVISIKQPRTGRTLTTKALPAIFAPAPGLAAASGKRGVLHTIWAKKRLSQLQTEIRQEMQSNSESVGLEMAVQEQQWIIQHFGLDDRDDRDERNVATARQMRINDMPPTPQSPVSPLGDRTRSPVGDRMTEKLKGLRLATSPTDLADPSAYNNSIYNHQRLYTLLSPDVSDIAEPSRASVPLAATTVTAANGPSVASLDAVMKEGPVGGVAESKDTGDELFAFPMSPRSPEMMKSPFSFL